MGDFPVWNGKPRRSPIGLGLEVRYGGSKWVVGSVMFTGGERYYMLQRKNETAMLPWSTVEPLNQDV